MGRRRTDVRRAGLPAVLALLALPALAVLPGKAQDVATPGRTVFVIPLSGTVDPSMAAFVKRALRDTGGDPDALYVFELDTFGGRVDSALQIVETLLAEPKGKTVAFVREKAISAGALVALACNTLVMRPNTTLGDCAPITYTGEGVQVMGEKFQSPLRAKFRTLARRNGYPPVLAESMVTEQMKVYRVEFRGRTVYLDAQEFEDLPDAEKQAVVSRRTVVDEGELLTMDDAEALELGFSSMTAAGIPEMLAAMGIERPAITRFETNWSEGLGRVIGALSPILLMIGLAALYTELKAPGFGAPGIVGIICLGLVLSHQYVVGLADYTELILVALGVVLLGIELFVLPGFGVAGYAGLACIAVGFLLSFQDFVVPDPSLPWQKEIFVRNLSLVVGSLIAALLSALAFVRYGLPRLGAVVEGPYLGATLQGAKAESLQAAGVRTGQEGVAVTPLRPAGKAGFGDALVDVITEGDFLERGTPVVVSRVQGSRVVVARRG